MEKPALDFPADRLDRLTDEAEQLAKRLEQVSSQLRILQALFVVTVLGLVGGGYALISTGVLSIGGGGEMVAKTIRSNEFGLINRAGDRLLLADNDKFGLPNLIFMDGNKNYRMGIKVWPDGNGTPGMVFYDQTGTRGSLRM